MLSYHILAFFAGFLLDLAAGDPYWLPHPIRLIGTWIGYLDKRLLGAPIGETKDSRRDCKGDSKRERRFGILLVFLVLLPAAIIPLLLLFFSYWLHPAAGLVLESIMTYQILAVKCLKVESVKVYRKLAEHDLAGARTAVSRIVGRDTEQLDEAGVAKAAIETVAENTSDGVIAPMLYLAIGGPVLGFLYKAINTMDSMVGYKNERYLMFGRAAAKLDDVVNFLPARISALLMIAAALPGREFSCKNAWRIFIRDRYQHASPNSAQTEAACAGAMGIQLAGNASYFGSIVEKPVIGDSERPVGAEDILKVNVLLYRTAFLAEAILLVILALFTFYQ